MTVLAFGILAYLCQNDISYKNFKAPVKVDAVVPDNYDSILLADLLILHREKLCTIIDIRTAQYFQQARIPSALNWNNPVNLPDEIKSATTIILYGNNFNASALRQFADTLEKHQMKPKIYWGGWEEWKACGLNYDSDIAE